MKKIFQVFLLVLSGAGSVFLYFLGWIHGNEVNTTGESVKTGGDAQKKKEEEIEKADGTDLLSRSPRATEYLGRAEKIKSGFREHVRARLDANIHSSGTE